MITSNQITPGMTIKVDGKVYRVESSVKGAATKASAFIKVKLRSLMDDKTIEKNFKAGQEVEEVSLVEHSLEYLYPEGKEFLFLDIENLEQVVVSPQILDDKIHYLKEGVEVKALFYGDTIFSVELPQFLELMVTKVEQSEEEGVSITQTMKQAVLETGAKVKVPLFIEIGDVIKVDTTTNEYIQRV
jgi:elongation factor P